MIVGGILKHQFFGCLFGNWSAFLRRSPICGTWETNLLSTWCFGIDECRTVHTVCDHLCHCVSSYLIGPINSKHSVRFLIFSVRPVFYMDGSGSVAVFIWRFRLETSLVITLVAVAGSDPTAQSCGSV